MPCYEVNETDFVIEAFDSDFIFLDQRDGNYYEAAEKVAELFRAIRSKICPIALLNAVADHDQTVAQEASQAIMQMQELGVITLVENVEGHAEGADEIALAMLGEGDFVLEGFAELSSFMLADPVHDVDATTGRFVWGQQAVG
ncbi:MAG: hypothetical protein AAFN63_08480 [Pseudomonadota bacterium]